jgi:hypothetical protein
MSDTETSLVAIPEDLANAPKAMAVFSEPIERFDVGALGVLVASLAKRAKEFSKTASIETRAGRDEIASFAYRLARFKTVLDSLGKSVADKIKELPKRVDANRKLVRDTIEGLQTEVRAPLTEYEAREKVRTEKHLAAIERLRATATSEFPLSTTSAEISAILTAVQEMPVDEATCEEFETDYRLEREQACARLAMAIIQRDRYESDQAELGRLRAAAEAQEAAAQISQEIVELHERALQAERDREREAREAAERQAREAEAARLRAENDARLAAERAAREAAEREAAELRMQEAERAAAAAETERRERSHKHRAAVHNAATSSIASILIDAGYASTFPALSADDLAKAIVVAIAKGQVPAVKIEY